MSFQFGDGFDCYAAWNDAVAGYWDSGSAGANVFVAGRFAGSQALSHVSATGILVKSSGVNGDAVHHVSLAFRQTAALSGTSAGLGLVFTDGVTPQCSVVFRSDGAILLTAGLPTGTTLATYAGAVSAQNTWFHFEIEVVVSNTAGWMKVRKNGNTTDDFTSSLTLDTQATANAYANKLQVGEWVTVNAQQIDDLLWRSDASSVPWAGDIRCITRMPASDVSVQFSRSTGATNFSCVDEAQQNAATDYVSSATPGHEDFYGIAAISSTPIATIAVTTRAYMQKSDAGARTASVQMKSGATTVSSNTATLASSSWGWTWRTDTTDPATGAAWTAVAVQNAQVGVKVIA